MAGREDNMTNPISRLLIKRRTDLPPGEVCEDVLRIGEDGALAWEHYDAGPSTKAVYGDYDLEIIFWVAKDYKDTVLLHLIAERFKDREEFSAWLRSKNIPAQAWSG